MSTVGTIFKKELRRVLCDKKMLLALFVFPVIIMLVIYGVMGVMMLRMQADIKEHASVIRVYQAPEDFKAFLETKKGLEVSYLKDEASVKKTKNAILTGDVDVMIAFDANFQTAVSKYQSGDEIPQVKTFYNPSEDYSSSAKSAVSQYLEEYRTKLLKERIGNLSDIQIFTVDSDNSESVIQDKGKAGGKTLGMFLPYMISILLFAGVMSLGVDAIAGEKERGTMASMLIAPVKRSHIVYGKLLSLMVLAAMSALVYGASMIVSFAVSGRFLKANGMELQLGVVQIILLLVLIVSTVFVYVAIIAICSVFAKSIKEASSYVTPAYMVVIIAGMMTMFVSGDTKTSAYFVPLYGSSMAMRNILTQEITNVQVLLVIAVNVVFGAILAAIVTRAFDNERVMFNA